MKKKILIAVGDCVHSEHAVKYTARISCAAKDVSYTLFNVQQLVPRIFSEVAENDPGVATEVDALIRENKKTAFVDLMQSILEGGRSHSRLANHPSLHSWFP